VALHRAPGEHEFGDEVVDSGEVVAPRDHRESSPPLEELSPVDQRSTSLAEIEGTPRIPRHDLLRAPWALRPGHFLLLAIEAGCHCLSWRSCEGSPTWSRPRASRGGWLSELRFDHHGAVAAGDEECEQVPESM